MLSCFRCLPSVCLYDHIDYQAFLSMGFSRQEYWHGLPCLPPGYLADPGIKPESLMSPALAGTFFTTNSTREALTNKSVSQFIYSVVPYSATPWTAAHQASLSITNSQSPPKPMSIESMMPPNHLILCHPLLLLPSIFPSIRVFSNETALRIRWPKYWSFSFSISPSNEYSGLISLGWTGWISVQSKGLSRVFSNTTFKSINSSALSFLYGPSLTSIHDYWKNHGFD